jgi:SAM-dependent methyltransferase
MSISTLVNLSTLEHLKCPTCSASIEKRKCGTYWCLNTQCSYYFEPFINCLGQPVLVDFNESVFSIEDYQNNSADGSILSRKRSNLQKFVFRLMWGSGRTAAKNLDVFINHLLDAVPKPTILVVGGGAIGNGIDNLYTDSRVNLISFDVYSSTITDFVADAHSIPLKNDCIDGVWIQYVLEHVLDPEKVASEISRVLKPRGMVYAETPFLQHVHEKNYDFTRFTESGHRWLFRNFEPIATGSATGPGTALVWSLRAFIAALARSKKVGKIATLFFFWLRFFDYLMPENYSSDGASSVYFLGQKSESSIQPSEIVTFFRGVK